MLNLKTMTSCSFGPGFVEQMRRGADGMKTAVLRKGRAGLQLIWAAAHAKR
jgi:hypothetical protein